MYIDSGLGKETRQEEEVSASRVECLPTCTGPLEDVTRALGAGLGPFLLQSAVFSRGCVKLNFVRSNRQDRVVTRDAF